MAALVANELADQSTVRYIIPLMSASMVKKLMITISQNQDVNGRFNYILNSEVGRDR